MTQNYFSNFNLKTTSADKFFSVLPDLYLSGALVQVDPDNLLLLLGPFQGNQTSQNEYNSSEDQDSVRLKNKQFQVSLSTQKFFESFNGWVTPKAAYLFSLHEIKEKFKTFAVGASQRQEHEAFLDLNQWVAKQKSEYEESYQLILKMIHQEQIEKAVPSTTFSHPLKMNYDLFLLGLKNLFAGQSGQTVSQSLYAYSSEGSGFFGLTPEYLFEYKDKNLKSMALAGTVKKDDKETKSSILKNKKLRHEHQLVVDDIKSVLGKYGFVKVSETDILELPFLYHLITKIEVLNAKAIFEQLIKSLHPTPALGVSPRNFGFHWLGKLQSEVNKDFHGAPLTVKIGNEFCKSFVCIRNIQWNSSGMKVVVGGGLVKDSRLDEEWQELENKKKAVLKSFGAREL